VLRNGRGDFILCEVIPCGTRCDFIICDHCDARVVMALVNVRGMRELCAGYAPMLPASIRRLVVRHSAPLSAVAIEL
tara:strand:- start:49 stop:279 length:231 start_codon:yes stop_codon:yes gene_type:complete